MLPIQRPRRSRFTDGVYNKQIGSSGVLTEPCCFVELQKRPYTKAARASTSGREAEDLRREG